MRLSLTARYKVTCTAGFHSAGVKASASRLAVHFPAQKEMDEILARNYPSYLAHFNALAERQCDISKKKHVGDLYEHAVADTLNRLCRTKLTKRGASGDRGIDLVGSLVFPGGGTVSIAGQCKCRVSTVSPAEVFSFIGACYVEHDEDQEVLALLVSSGGVSPGANAIMTKTRLPMINIIMKSLDRSRLDNSDAHFTMTPNSAAELMLEKHGLEIVAVDKEHSVIGQKKIVQ